MASDISLIDQLKRRAQASHLQARAPQSNDISTSPFHPSRAESKQPSSTSRPNQRRGSVPPRTTGSSSGASAATGVRSRATTEGGPTLCKSCGEVIVGKCIAWHGRHFHLEHFVCVRCGKPVRQYAEHNGQVYCSEDYAELFGKRCGCGCGEAVMGATLEALGKVWKPDHFTCTKCKKPLTGRYLLDKLKQPYCQRDYEKLFCDKCHVCQQALLNRRVETNFWGEKMCAVHRATGAKAGAAGVPVAVPECFDCGHYLAQKQAQAVFDHRSFCQPCAAVGVRDKAQAEALLAEVRARFAQYGVRAEGTIPIDLASGEKLRRSCTKRASSHVHAHCLGLTRTKLLQEHTVVVRPSDRKPSITDTKTRRFLKGILVQAGLSPELTASILAHEFGHCYMFMHRFPQLAPEVEEGVCELFNWVWITQSTDTPSMQRRHSLIKDNPDPVYGGGFRAAHHALMNRFKGNLADLLDCVKQNRKF